MAMAWTAQAATSHSGASATPAIAKGVITSVTQGMATALANSPTTDTWPNNSKVSGVKASVITHCSRNDARTLDPIPATRTAQATGKPGILGTLAGGGEGKPASVANNTPTA